MGMWMIDEEVGKRLLKGLDVLALTTTSLTSNVLFAQTSNANTPVLSDFYTLTLTFLCRYLLRGFGLYDAKSLARVLPNIALSITAVAIVVRFESKGPIIFKQKRFGFNNELIEVYKFRSMFTDMSDATAEKLVTKGDLRVTKVGRVIRKTSLDELPQLFNVLTRQLALVGPRPHAAQAKAKPQAAYMMKLLTVILHATK